MGGNMISSSEDIAIYKVATLIPFNLLFIPTAILKADFIYLSENSLTKEVFKNYIKKYWSIFSLLSILIFIIFFINYELIIVSLFGNIYLEAHNILRVLII